MHEDWYHNDSVSDVVLLTASTFLVTEYAACRPHMGWNINAVDAVSLVLWGI